jgi:hypothetical protein
MLGAWGAAMLAVAQAGTPPPAPPPASTPVPARPDLRFDPGKVPDPQRVLDVLDYTAAAQIEQLRAKPFTLTGGSVDQITANWVSAAFYTGASRLVRVSNRSGSARFLREVADH